MFITIFSDEVKLDLQEAIPHFQEWGLRHVDLRGLVLGKDAERLTREELLRVRQILDEAGLQATCMQTSIGKQHLPDDEVTADQHKKLDVVLQACEILGPKLVRFFHFWQPKGDERGKLAESPHFDRVLDLTRPLVERAASAGLTIGFENCGVSTFEVAAVCDALGHDQCGLFWDVYNGWNSEAALFDSEEEYIESRLPLTKGVHMKAKKALSGPGCEAPLPWDKVYRALAQTGYTGPICVETHAPAECREQLGNLETNRRLVRFAFDLLADVRAAD